MTNRIQRNVLTGVLTVIPIVVTVWIIQLLVNLLIGFGSPFVFGIARVVWPYAPDLAEWLMTSWFQSILAIVIVLFGLYVLGAIASIMVGRRVLALVDRIMGRIPLAKTIYGSVRRLVQALTEKPAGAQRVVLIEFPSPEMKTVGLVTRTFNDADTGQELAAVYVPTTPNPTNGYIEIVPVEKLVFLNWSANDAMTFVMSGGAVAPDLINYAKSAEPV